MIGAGQCGSTAVLRLAEAGVDVLCLEAQSWKKYSVYLTDMAVYNAKIFLNRGVPPSNYRGNPGFRGEVCGQRYAVQYHTPTAGNSCGSALTTGYVAAEHIMAFLNAGHER